MSRFRIGLLISLAVLSGGSVHADVEIKPVTEFKFEHAYSNHARLSPDGQYVAVAVAVGTKPDAVNLVTMRLSDYSAKVITGFSDSNVGSVFWATEDRLVFSIYEGSSQSGAVRVYRDSYTIHRDGSGGRKMYQPRVRKSAAGRYRTGTAPQLLHRMPTDPKNVLITRTSPLDRFPEVYRLDVETGYPRKVDAGEFKATQWFADHIGNVRAAVDKGADVLDGQERLLYRASADSDWREVVASDYVSGLSVLAFHPDNRRLIVLAQRGQDRYGHKRDLYLLSPDGELVDALLSDDVHDVGNLSGGAAGLKQTSRGHLVYYQYMADTLRTVYFDLRWKSRQELIDEALADTVNTIVDWSDDERQLLVFARLDNGTGDYYLFGTTHQELKFLQPPAQWVKTPD